MRSLLVRTILSFSALAITAAAVAAPPPHDPVNAVAAPAGANGYPSRAANFDALPGFQNPPPGYGEVPFWWWTGDPLDVDRLIWQLDELHKKGISGVQVNYAHEDSPGWPTYAAEPPIFSAAWWRIWGRVADECRRRGMGIGLSTYTLDWPNGDNLFRKLFYSQPELNALRLTAPARRPLSAGQSVTIAVGDNLIAARAYCTKGGRIERGGVDLLPHVRNGQIVWTAPAGQWEVWEFRADRQPNTINPLLAGVGAVVIRDFYQRFQDATPSKSSAGLNYFFNDELHIGAGTHVWNADFAAEFRQRKGYDLFEVLPALWIDLGPVTPKVRMDYADVRMALMEERYFQPIYRWHAARGLIFACDSGGRGQRPDEFGDYFRATRWYTAPGHDTPGGSANLIKDKVSSSIANLYRRPRVWLEGYHSLGWGATPERLMFATRENFLYGCTLLNLHGLYYTTHGSFWEWAPPCYHFRMPYWEHLGVFLKYFERLSFLLSQGAFVCDVAVLYPVAPYEAGLDGKRATQAAFDTARCLMAAGVNFEFIDADSLARARVREGRLEVADSSYRALIFPAMEAARWSTLQTARDFAASGGLVLSVGPLPSASDRAGRDDRELDALVGATFAPAHRLAQPTDVLAPILTAFTPDTQADKPVRTLHRKVGPRDVYMVMDAAPNSVVEFRAKGRVELWDPWTGATQPLRVLQETPTGTKVELPLQPYEAQLVVFTPGEAHANPPRAEQRPRQPLVLEGDWEFELRPTMDNRFGDFRLPAIDKVIGPEARMFRHAVESGGAADWRKPAFDDRRWERVTYDVGPQFWLLGPFPADSDGAALDAELAKLTRVDPQAAIQVGAKTVRWRPYSFSWRQGLEGDPGHQGWHGLKENVTDHFLCLGKRTNGLNEFKYEPEQSGSRYYLWTSATVDRPTAARIAASVAREGQRPHASAVLTPAAVFLNGQRVANLERSLDLQSGANPLLVRYDRAGRGYFVVKRAGAEAVAPHRTPLAMNWFDDPAVIRFDVHAGARPAQWFRFTAPPGLCAMTLTAKGTVEAWADDQPMRAAGQGRFEAVAPLRRAALVALRVTPEVGVAGGAVLPEPVRLECGPGLIALGDWSQMGVLECYSGGAWYRKTVTLSPAQARGPITLDLGKVVATAEVRVNGQVAGIRVAPPWRLDISQQVRPGANRIEILVFNTLANHYLTIPTRYRGSPTSGLLGPVVLEMPASADVLEGRAAQERPVTTGSQESVNTTPNKRTIGSAVVNTANAAAGDVTLHVSPRGDDAHPGTADQPLATIAGAQRALPARADRRRATVLLHTGTYYLPETVRFTPADSGLGALPVVYAAAPGEKPILSGGVRLNLQWTPSGNGIFQAQTPAGLTMDQLFINGQRQHMARYPNYDPQARQFNGAAADAISPQRASRWADPTGGYIHAMHAALWGDMHWRILGKQPDGTLNYEGGWQNNRSSPMHKQYRFVENLREELDAPGEWFHDARQRILYFFPPTGLDLPAATVEVVRLRHLIEFQGTQDQPVKFITLRGLTFRHTARTFMDNREPLLRSDWTVYRGGAVVSTGAEDLTIEDCDFDQLGGTAVFVNNYNRRITVRGCLLRESGANGVAFVGDPQAVRSPLFNYSQKFDHAALDRTPGPRSANFPADCLVDDCLITRSGRFEKQTAPVEIDMAQRITVRHCSIYDVPRAGINVGGGCWGGHIIEHCDVFDTVLETGDHGSFNSWGRDRYWHPDVRLVDRQVAADPKLPFLDMLQPTTLRFNRWRCDHGWDIDLDDGSTRYRIHNNLLLHGGLKLREGYDRIATHNIIVGNSLHPHVWFENSGDVFAHNIVMGPYRPARMDIARWGKEVDRNLFTTTQADRTKFLDKGCDAHSLVGDPRFIDAARGDFRCQDGSLAGQLGFMNYSQDDFGVRSPRLRVLAKTPTLPSGSAPAETAAATQATWQGATLRELLHFEFSAVGVAADAGGVFLAEVPAQSPAFAAGLRKGDLIQAVGSHAVRGVKDFLSALDGAAAGRTLKLEIVRNQQRTSLELPAGAVKSSPGK